MKECMNGFALVKEIIGFSRDGAVDTLLSKAVGECDWLELKASFFVSGSDPDFSNQILLSKKPEDYSDRQWLDELNKGRIVKDIVAMYNSRGGVIFIGISPDQSHKLVPMGQNDVYGILSSGNKDVNDYVGKINELLAKGYFWFGTARHYLSRPVSSLYEVTLLPYGNGHVIALMVKAAEHHDLCGITCDDERSTRNAKSYLVFRTQVGNNREELVSGITEKKKDELDKWRFELLQKGDLERLFHEITGGESHPLPAGPVTWRQVWQRLWTFSFRGKASRTELWMSYGYYAMFIAGAICLSMIFGSSRILAIVQLLGFVLMAPPFVRRLHDLGLSGWSLLVVIGLGMFEGFFPNLLAAKRIINGFFFLALLSLGCFPGRRMYGRYKGAAFCIVFFLLLLLAGFMNRGEVRGVGELPFTGNVSDLEGEPNPTGDDAIVYGLDAVGNEYEETFDKVVIPALKERKGEGMVVLGTSIERMASDVRRVGFLAEQLSRKSSELGAVNRELRGMLKSLIAAFDELAKVTMRKSVAPEEIRKSFARVEQETDNLFRKADILCKNRLKGPFLGLIHRIGDALKTY